MVIRNADVLVETSVFGVAATSRALYERLARLAHRLTARPEYGKLWVPSITLDEMAATPVPRRADVLGVLLNLYRELGDRIVLTGELEQIVAGEWATPPRFASVPIGQLEEDLVACVRGSGAGTKIDAMGREFAAWRRERRAEHDKFLMELEKKYAADPKARQAISLALDKARQPTELYEFCDDIAAQLIREFAGKDPVEGLKLAKAEPERYLATWTYSLLLRVAQFAQTIPPRERSTSPFGAYAKLLKSHENDIIDATLAAVGAVCGLLITQDGGLRERLNFLHGRHVSRIQAFEFSEVEAYWIEPGVAAG